VKEPVVVQNPTFTLTELVYQPMATSLPREDFALLLEERIREAAELEVKCQELQDRVDDLESEAEGRRKDDDAFAVLRALVEAIDKVKLGKLCRVGALVVVEDEGDLAQKLGAALTDARALL
jgi:hypothetical protein